GFLRRAFEAGADDYVTLPESAGHVLFALQKAIARKAGGAAATGVAQSPMICVLGPKGGTGKTLTACNLAVGLASAGNRVALVDLDLQFGDVGLALGLAPDQTIYDLAKAGGSIDAEKIEAYLTEHPSGLHVLLAPTRPDHARGRRSDRRTPTRCPGPERPRDLPLCERRESDRARQRTLGSGASVSAARRPLRSSQGRERRSDAPEDSAPADEEERVMELH